MNYSEQPTSGSHSADEISEPVSISHFIHALRSYQNAILIALIAVALAYAIVAILMYVLAPAQRITTQHFRLDFEGATSGHYPNGAKFNVAEIVSAPILQRVYVQNHLSDLLSFEDLTSSVFVLESNQAYEALAADYQARLADPKLSPVDRDRIQNEFELKRRSIAKDEYSINFVQPATLHTVPDPIARKILLDVLNGWADFEVRQQHVLSYRLAVLSPEILKPNAIELNDPIIAVQVLRGKANRVITNIKDIMDLPGGNLVRTEKDSVSLDEIRLRLEEIIRYQLEPLVTVASGSGLVSDPASTIRFFEGQMAADQRDLQAQVGLAETRRQAIAVYEQPQSTMTATAVTPAAGSQGGKAAAPAASETVMPQLSDTFLERLMTLTDRAADLEYRQKLVDQYRDAVAGTIPLQKAVAYDTQVLKEIRGGSPGGRGNATAASVKAQIDDARAEIGRLIGKTNELYQIVSRNMTSSTQLFTLTSPAVTRTLRPVSLSRLGLYGVVVMLVAIPLLVLFALFHQRLREEEAAEGYLRADTPAGS